MIRLFLSRPSLLAVFPRSSVFAKLAFAFFVAQIVALTGGRDAPDTLARLKGATVLGKTFAILFARGFLLSLFLILLLLFRCFGATLLEISFALGQ